MTHYQTLRSFAFSFAFATSLITGVISNPSVRAAVIIQRAGHTHVAWEAEDFFANVAVNNNPWEVVSDAAASGGQALRADGSDWTAPGGGVATYQLQFAEEGTYRLYFRMKSFDGNSDSMFRPVDFGVEPTDDPSPHLPITGGVYEWFNDGGSPQPRYVVGSGDLGATLTLSVGSRESDFHVDRFLLSTDTGLSDAQLDALLNWDAYTYFTGDVDSDWSNAGNWDGGVPVSTSGAYIGDGKTADLDTSAAVRQLLIGHTDPVLPGDGTLNQTGGDMTVTERLAVGEMTSGSPGDSLAGSYTFGGGTVTVGQEATGRADLYIAHNTVAGTANNADERVVAEGTLDLGGAEEFNAYLNNLAVGRLTREYARANGTLILAETNTIDATTFIISNLRHFRGRSASNDHSEVVLGQTNTISTDLLTVGGDRGQGTVKFADDADSPTLNLLGSSGDKANLRIGYTGADTSPRGSGTMDLSGGTFDATLGEVVLGYRGGRGSGTATLTFDDGTVTADSLMLGSVAWSRGNTGAATYTGILNMGGGSFDVAGDVTAGFGRNPTGTITATASRSSHGTGTINVAGGEFSAASLTLGTAEYHADVVTRGTGTLNVSGGADAQFSGNVALGMVTSQSAGTINVAGGTVEVDGSVTDGPGSSTIRVDRGTMTVGGDLNVGALRVGHNEGIAVLTAGGDVEIGSDSARTNLFIGNTTLAGQAGDPVIVEGTLDLSDAGELTVFLDQLVVGRLTASHSRATGTLLLAETNTIDAAEIIISDLRTHVGRSAADKTSRIVLGQTNTIRTDLLTVAGQRGLASLEFAAGVENGTLELTGSTGEKADLRIAYTDHDTAYRGEGSIDLSGGTFDATLGEVIVGYRAARGTGTATLAFDAGTVTADSLLLGSAGHSTIGGSREFTGTLNMGGGSFAIEGDVTAGTGTAEGTGEINLSGGTFTVGGGVLLGHGETDGDYSGTGAGTMNISGGAAEIDGGITLGTGTETSTGTINLAGGTLTVDGSVTEGVGSSTVRVDRGTMTVGGDLKVGALRVGHNEGTAVLTAGGDVEIGSDSARTNLFIGNTTLAGQPGDPVIVEGTLDLSEADSFTAYLNDLLLGRLTSAHSHATGTLKLAETNTIHANQIVMSDIRDWQGDGDLSRIVLGQTNTIATNLLTVGGQRSYATLAFADGITDGVLTLTGPAGDKADLRIAYTDYDTGHGGSCTMDLTGGTFNATLGEVVVGYREARGSGTATLSFGDGIVTADSLVLGSAGYSSAHSGAANYTGILDMGGGSFTIDGNVIAGTGTGRGTGTINLTDGAFAADSLALGEGEVHGSGYVGQATGTLNVSGGTAQIDDITLGTGTETSTGTINLAGGTLAAQSISGGVGTAEFDWTGGTLDVGTFGHSERRFDLVQDGGTLAPGTSSGTTNIYGNYTMDDGVLEIEIAGPGAGGTDYDLVWVDGDTTLAGTLDALFLDDFLPAPGNRFDVLQTTGLLDIDGLELSVDPLTFGWWEMAAIPRIGVDGYTLRLSAVPEPTGALLALLALAGLLGCIRPRRRAR